MKKNFTQPFIKSEIIIYPLIEVDSLFLQFTNTDELDTFYAETLQVHLTLDEDITLKLAELLHRNGLELLEYRELVRETNVEYSYLDSTPGKSTDTICMYIKAEATNRPLPHVLNMTTSYISLDTFLSNLHASVTPNGIVELGTLYLLKEQGELK